MWKKCPDKTLLLYRVKFGCKTNQPTNEEKKRETKRSFWKLICSLIHVIKEGYCKIRTVPRLKGFGVCKPVEMCLGLFLKEGWKKDVFSVNKFTDCKHTPSCSFCDPSFPTLGCELVTDGSVLASLFPPLKLREVGRSKLPSKGQVDTSLPSFKIS